MASGESEHYYGDLGPDPFAPTPTRKLNAFEAQLLPLGQTTSPDEVKAQLQQHLAETEKRIEQAGRLGTTLVQQQNQLADRLREVEEQQANGEISPELTQKLLDIEREFNDAGRDSSRILAAKSRASSGEMGAHPFEPKVFTPLFCFCCSKKLLYTALVARPCVRTCIWHHCHCSYRQLS